MDIAYPAQKLQDWFTQQWVILTGQKIDEKLASWLIGPFGDIGVISDTFAGELARKEGLTVTRNARAKGLISSLRNLKLAQADYRRLSKEIKNFYENTTQYELHFSVHWNPVFRFFGKLVSWLFSRRIAQLNIPTNNFEKPLPIHSEIITLNKRPSGETVHTIWYRTFGVQMQVLYSGVYTLCTMPNGTVCVKAVFPLPRGNATVIMQPSVGPHGELSLLSSGKKFGDPGFYFLLEDSQGRIWSRYLRSFRDHLVVQSQRGQITAKQILTLWNLKVVQFDYEIVRIPKMKRN